MSSAVNDFLDSPIFSWLESCLARPEILSSYSALLDGTIIHSVLLQIDPEPQHHPTKLEGLDGALLGNARAKNFDTIVRNLRNLYEEELGQYILILPDCSILGHRPETKEGLEQMRLLLILLLGAAVQCPSKEIFISRIKELDVHLQHGIVEMIKQVTDDQTLVLTTENRDGLNGDLMYKHLMRIMKERDVYHSNWIGSLTTVEQEQQPTNSGSAVLSPGSSQSNRSTPGTATTPSSSGTNPGMDNNHVVVELADLKSKLRKLRQELEEKSEAFIEVKEELDHKSSQYDKLRTESHDWYTEARRAAAYRDEVDVLRERAERADRLEVEVQKFREKLSDSEFYKTRVEELREDNRMLLETKDMLEDQLQRARKRGDQIMVLESEIIKYKQKLNDAALERDIDKSKLQDLVDENTQLQLAHKTAATAITDQSMSDNDDENRSGDNSLSEQLTNNAQTRALKLELENRRLLSTLEAMKESSFVESSGKILELEKDKKKLSLKLEQLQDNCNRLVQQNQELESVFKNALEENKKVQDALDARKQANDRQSMEREADRSKIIDLEKQIETLTKEKQRVQRLGESIQRRADDMERSYETKCREIESLNPKVIELEGIKSKHDDLQEKVLTIEKENCNLMKEINKLREVLELRDIILDENTAAIQSKDKEIHSLCRKLEETVAEVKKLQEMEKENQELTSQRKIDSETISTLQKDLVNGELNRNKMKQGLEKLGLDSTELETDFNVDAVVEKLVKNPETFKTVKEFVLNTSREQRKSSDMCVLCHKTEIFTVEKQIEITNECDDDNFVTHTEQVVSSVSAKWKEQCDQLYTENALLQSTIEQLKTEGARHKVDTATLNSQIGSLNTQQVALQVANSQLVAEKDTLLRQLEAIKQKHELLVHDQVSLQCLHEQLTSEYEALNAEKESMRTALRDLRVENRDLKERINALENSKEELKSEIESSKTETTSLTNLKQEHSKLKDDFRNLFTQSDRMKQEYKSMQDQYRSMRTENSQLKLQSTELQGELNNRTDYATGLDIELTKVSQRCEMLLQMNSNLDSDRRTLMDHVSQLLSQYHELLVTSLDDKQHYHDEEKQFTDRVNNLHRQKEKLEEKIMEHYRKLDSCSPKKKPFGSSLVKRVRKAGSDLMSKVPTRHRRSWIDDSRLSHSQILGSESGGNDSDNSLEEPSSLASDSRPLNRHSNLRQSLQRKSASDLKLIESSLTRGGVRSSLQQLSNSNHSTPTRRLAEKPKVSNDKVEPAGHVVANLGTAGSRRTVYMVDENQKIADPMNQSSSSSGSNAGGQSSTNGGNVVGGSGGGSGGGGGEPTLLMYNRISNVISSPLILDHASSTAADNDNKMANVNGKSSTNANNMDDKEKESAIWYEYGCV